MSETRERFTALLLLGVIFLAGGGFLGYQFLYRPVADRDASIRELQKQIADREQRIAKIEKALPRLEQYKKLSLPADVDLARREYAMYLEQLLRKHGFEGVSVTAPRESTANVPTLGRKKPVYTRLECTVQAQNVELLKLIGFLEDFYRTNLLHQIRTITVRRERVAAVASREPQREARDGRDSRDERGGSRGPRNPLSVTLTVEALVLDQAEKRDTLLPSKDVPPLPVLAEGPRLYASIAGRDIFFGPPPAPTRTERQEPEFDASPFVRLTSITYRNTRAPETDAALQLLAGGGAAVLPDYNVAVAEMWDAANNYDYIIARNFDGRTRVESYQYILPDNRRRWLERPSESLVFGSEDSGTYKRFRVVRIDPTELILERLDGRPAGLDAAGLLAGGAAPEALPRHVYRWHVGEALRDIRRVPARDAWLILGTPAGVPVPRAAPEPPRRGLAFPRR